MRVSRFLVPLIIFIVIMTRVTLGYIYLGEGALFGIFICMLFVVFGVWETLREDFKRD